MGEFKHSQRFAAHACTVCWVKKLYLIINLAVKSKGRYNESQQSHNWWGQWQLVVCLLLAERDSSLDIQIPTETMPKNICLGHQVSRDFYWVNTYMVEDMLWISGEDVCTPHWLLHIKYLRHPMSMNIYFLAFPAIEQTWCLLVMVFSDQWSSCFDKIVQATNISGKIIPPLSWHCEHTAIYPIQLELLHPNFLGKQYETLFLQNQFELKMF